MPTTRELYDALDLPMLKRWVQEQQQEDLRLDFKLLAGDGELAKDDRKNLMRAVSGFANGDGGLIVWGVDCRKNDDGVDAAKELKPIRNVAAVLSQLRDNPSQITSPIVDGVEHKLIAGSEGGTGFLVTYVPASDRGPHMANDRLYYKRNGTSFLTMEHFDVADMFGRRQRPDLRLTLSFEKDPTSTEEHHKYRLVGRLKNHGRACARICKVIVTMPADVAGWERQPPLPAWNLQQARTAEIRTQPLPPFTQNLFPIFPEEEITANFDQPLYHMTHDLHDIFDGRWPDVTVLIYQDDCPPTFEKISFQKLNKF